MEKIDIKDLKNKLGFCLEQIQVKNTQLIIS